jgi:hypothetical protein
VSAPFSDQRAFNIISEKHGQLPDDGPGIVMVDVTGQGTAFESWPDQSLQSFTPEIYNRISGVLMFNSAVVAGANQWLSLAKLVLNPHARTPVPTWIHDLVDEIRQSWRAAIAVG